MINGCHCSPVIHRVINTINNNGLRWADYYTELMFPKVFIYFQIHYMYYKRLYLNINSIKKKLLDKVRKNNLTITKIVILRKFCYIFCNFYIM